MKGTGKIWIFYDPVTKKQTKPLSTLQAQMALLNLRGKEPGRYFLWTPGWTEWIPLTRFLDSDQTYFVFAPDPDEGAYTPPPPLAAFNDEKTVRAGKTKTRITKVTRTDIRAENDPLFTEILLTDAPPPKKDDFGYYYEDFSADKIDPDAKPSMKFKTGSSTDDDPRNRRRDERHHFKIEVILINKSGRTFRTTSQNISLGGTLLAEDLPKEFVNTRFDLIIINKFEKDPAKGRLHFHGRVVGDYLNPRRLMFMDTDEHVLKGLAQMLKSYSDHQNKLKKKPAAG